MSANSIFHPSRIASTSVLLLSCPRIPTRKLTHSDLISGVIFPSTGKCLGHSSGKIETVSGTARTWEVIMVALYKAYAGQRKQTRDEKGEAGMGMHGCQCQCQTQRDTASVLYLCVFTLYLLLVILVMLVMLVMMVLCMQSVEKPRRYSALCLSEPTGRYLRNGSAEMPSLQPPTAKNEDRFSCITTAITAVPLPLCSPAAVIPRSELACMQLTL